MQLSYKKLFIITCYTYNNKSYILTVVSELALLN